MRNISLMRQPYLHNIESPVRLLIVTAPQLPVISIPAIAVI